MTQLAITIQPYIPTGHAVRERKSAFAAAHIPLPKERSRIGAIALLETSRSDLSVQREIRYIDGAQRVLDEAYGWGLKWAAGRK
mgnify:CR=1 FL=1